MKIQQTDTYPCGQTKTYPRYEFWGFAYTHNSGKPGCPHHGHRNTCRPETSIKLTPAQLEEAKRILAET